ncbi:MAG: hypothetical protein ACFFBP_06940 [Promethearchaeota archaeon]
MSRTIGGIITSSTSIITQFKIPTCPDARLSTAREFFYFFYLTSSYNY